MTNDDISIYDAITLPPFKGTKLIVIDDSDLARFLCARRKPFLHLTFHELSSLVARLQIEKPELWGTGILRKRGADKTTVHDYQIAFRQHRYILDFLFTNGNYLGEKPIIIGDEEIYVTRKEAEAQLTRWRRKQKSYFKPDGSGLQDKPTESQREAVTDPPNQLKKFIRECKALPLEKGKTIPRSDLFRIMRKIGAYDGTFDNFKSGRAAYDMGREYAKRAGYNLTRLRSSD